MLRPNLLLLYTDQQRWDTLGAAGNPLARTPHLDALAARGALFEHAFCNNPVCMPSRHSLLSGQYPSTLGATCNGIELPEDVPTLATLLKPHGYHTASIGKLHFKNHSNRDHRLPHPAYGFDTLIVADEPGCYEDAYLAWVRAKEPAQVDRCRCEPPPAVGGNPFLCPPRAAETPYVFAADERLSHTAFVADRCAEFIRRHRREPFALIAGFYAPHAPLNPPARFVAMHDADAMPPPAVEAAPAYPGHRPQALPPAQWRKVRAYYAALVSHIDDQIGRLLAALDECGLRDNTLVLFTSDHGEHLGDHGLTGKGPPNWDSCIHVPLLAALPARFRGGQRQADLVEQVDVLPTILECCGVPVPPALQGRSFLPLLEGRAYQPRASVFCEYAVPWRTSWKTVRTRAWKYSVNEAGIELLYDLGRDPQEGRNLAAEPTAAAALGEMRRELLRRWFTVEAQSPRRTGPY